MVRGARTARRLSACSCPAPAEEWQTVDTIVDKSKLLTFAFQFSAVSEKYYSRQCAEADALKRAAVEWRRRCSKFSVERSLSRSLTSIFLMSQWASLARSSEAESRLSSGVGVMESSSRSATAQNLVRTTSRATVNQISGGRKPNSGQQVLRGVRCSSRVDRQVPRRCPACRTRGETPVTRLSFCGELRIRSRSSMSSRLSGPSSIPRAIRPLLIKLGVRDTPTGPDRLLDRLRALATVDNPPVYEVEKWYHRLDQLVEQVLDLKRSTKSSGAFRRREDHPDRGQRLGDSAVRSLPRGG
jgi:hypothetical protein